MKSIVSSLILAMIFTLPVYSVSKTAKSYYNKALQELRKENFEAAEAYLLNALKEEKHYKISLWLSYTYAQLQEKEKCKKYADLTRELNSSLTEADQKKMDALEEWINSERSRLIVRGRFPADDKSKAPDTFKITKKEKLR